MTLTSAALGLASSSKEDTNEDASLSPPYLIVLVDLYKCSGSKGYYPSLALVDSSATYNFIFKSIADKLGLEAVKAGKSKVKKKALPPITTVNGEPLRATAVIRQMVWMRNSAGTKQSHVINFVIADIAHHDLIFGVAWLQKQNPDINWDTRV